jgi:hypothetical protein
VKGEGGGGGGVWAPWIWWGVGPILRARSWGIGIISGFLIPWAAAYSDKCKNSNKSVCVIMMVLFILAMLPGVRAGSARVYEKCAEILWTKIRWGGSLRTPTEVFGKTVSNCFEAVASLPIYGRCSYCFGVSSFQMRRCIKRCHRQGCKDDELAVAAIFLEHV